MEKIIVNENIIRQNEVLAQANDSIKMINEELTAILQKLGIKKLTPAIFEDLILKSGNEFEKDYFKRVDKDLGVVSTKSIRDSFLGKAESAYNNFESKMTEIKKELKQAAYLTINDKGICELTRENKTKLVESVMKIISDNKEIELYKTHVEAAKVLNKLFGGSIPLCWYNLFVFENNKIVPNENTDYSYLVKNNKTN